MAAAFINGLINREACCDRWFLVTNQPVENLTNRLTGRVSPPLTVSTHTHTHVTASLTTQTAYTTQNKC